MIECPRLVGRYVTVHLTGLDKILQLCEVQVFEPCDETCYNLALHQSILEPGHNNSSVDGNTNTHFDGSTCDDDRSSVTVDLGHVTTIGKVRVWNRNECPYCSHDATDEFQVLFGMSDDVASNPACNYNSTQYKVRKGEAVEVECNANHLGRYVTIAQDRTSHLGVCEIEVYATGNCYDSGCYNVAKRKPVRPSMSGIKFFASNAVDGNYWNTLLPQGSCFDTEMYGYFWFRVDLYQEMIINKVFLTRDCCDNILSKLEIRIGSTLETYVDHTPVCRQDLRTFRDGSSVPYSCPNMMGRYVMLEIRERDDNRMSICEVQVCARLAPNLALGKPTTQISTHFRGYSFRAVDGNPNPDYFNYACSHTYSETKPWWRVDLQEQFLVTSLRITNRGDCCGDRLNNLHIRVGISLEFDGNNNPKCLAHMWNIRQGHTNTIMCNDGYGLHGRYVNLLIPGEDNVLTVCEVVVFGRRVRQCQLNGMANEGCTQPCPAKTGGIGCHHCPQGRVGRLRHVKSGLCAVPDHNRTFPEASERLVMTQSCDGIESLFLYSPSKLLYHVASGTCVMVDGNPKKNRGNPLVLSHNCSVHDRAMMYTFNNTRLVNVETKRCILVKGLCVLL
ncbi:uncharacterized protein LOC134198266 [Corticium candelabrum]|uniref:uncharacterized protein LOC134198266 n=1 Tax=Corticium candelabrum TaxID=121492 RepID=UPI002E26F9D5|nr:uncharacterized protein LOC134198266 [Corticium candelabrum]